MFAVVGYPTVLALVMGNIGSAMARIGSEVAREVGTGSVGDREVAGLYQRDGSKMTRVVGYLCLRRTWKSPLFRVSSRWEIVSECTKSCSCGGEVCKTLIVGRKRIALLCVILLHPARGQRTYVYQVR